MSLRLLALRKCFQSHFVQLYHVIAVKMKASSECFSQILIKMCVEMSDALKSTKLHRKNDECNWLQCYTFYNYPFFCLLLWVLWLIRVNSTPFLYFYVLQPLCLLCLVFKFPLGCIHFHNIVLLYV